MTLFDYLERHQIVAVFFYWVGLLLLASVACTVLAFMRWIERQP